MALIHELCFHRTMAATTDHVSFPQPQDPDVPVWRYMDLSKFASLLQQRALIFARCDLLGDPFEGSVPLPNARFWEEVKRIKRETPDADKFASIPEDRLDEIARMSSRTRIGMTRSAYINCWHMNEAESAAMWKLYSKSDEAICVRSTYSRLASALPIDAFLGTVRYIDFTNDHIDEGNLFNALMIKRRSFSHEREARAIIWDILNFPMDGKETVEPAPIRAVKVDVSDLIQSVYVAPQAPDWFRDVVLGLSRKYGLQVPISHSELNAKPLF